jgi:hypothetical protein
MQRLPRWLIQLRRSHLGEELSRLWVKSVDFGLPDESALPPRASGKPRLLAFAFQSKADICSVGKARHSISSSEATCSVIGTDRASALAVLHRLFLAFGRDSRIQGPKAESRDECGLTPSLEFRCARAAFESEIRLARCP